jgi:ABC-type antimicrobial peptide transport system permease subunit
MSWVKRLAGSLRKNKLEAQLDDELEFYLQQPPDFRGGSIMSHLAQTVMIRSASDVEGGLVTAAKKAVAEIDPEQPITDVKTLEQMFTEGTVDYQFYANLLEVFASIALLLALIGIYGSMSYFVSARTREIGIRVALGASRAGILRMVTTLGLRIAVIGVVIGIALAIGLTRVIAVFLFGVTATDPATFTVVGFGLIAVALLACLIPACRATKVDPMAALWHE